MRRERGGRGRGEGGERGEEERGEEEGEGREREEGEEEMETRNVRVSHPTPSFSQDNRP